MIRTVFNIALILLIGVGLGLAIRSMRPASRSDAPGPDDIVFTNSGDDDVSPEEVENATPTHPPEDEAWLSRFELTERSGETVSSEELLGQPYLVSFFFTTCPGSCTRQNQKLKELQEEFEGQGVRFVAITVDPETDTPERLREYAARYGADEKQWLFMTGDLTYIRRIGAEIFMQPINKQFHSDRFVLVDPEGEIEGFYNWPEKQHMKKLRAKLQEYLDGQETS